MLTTVTLAVHLKTQYHLMEACFLIFLSLHQIPDVAAECSYNFACHLCNEYFDEKFQVTQYVASYQCFIPVSCTLLIDKCTYIVYMSNA